MRITVILFFIFFAFTMAKESISLKKVEKFQIDEETFRNLIKDAEKNSEMEIQKFLNKMEQFPLVSDFPNRNVNWTKCENIRVIGKTCIELYADQSQAKVGVRLIVRERIIFDQYVEAKGCLDEMTLLRVISLIPQLLPFKPVIDRIIQFYGYIPANIFSICVQLKDVKATRKKISGQVVLNSKLMCLRGYCLQRGEKDYGRFKIKIPFKK
eukprot:gene8113-12574_t